ncbi:MAG: hypothetical protein ABJB61_07140 [bacterium]
MHRAILIGEPYTVEKQPAAKFLRDNPVLDRFIEVGTKALRRGLMSGETLRAPRQQLRRLRASVFDLFSKSPTIARLFGARRVFRSSVESIPEQRGSYPLSLPIRKTKGAIRKNLAQVTGICRNEHCIPTSFFCSFMEKRFA